MLVVTAASHELAKACGLLTSLYLYLSTIRDTATFNWGVTYTSGIDQIIHQRISGRPNFL